MRRWSQVVAWVLVVAVLYASSVAKADECTGLKLKPKVVQIDGKEYSALTPFEMSCLAKRAAEASVLKSQDALIDALEHQVETSSQALILSKELLTLERSRSEGLLKLTEEQAKALSISKYEPVIWSGAGALAAVLLFALIARIPTR